MRNPKSQRSGQLTRSVLECGDSSPLLVRDLSLASTPTSGGQSPITQNCDESQHAKTWRLTRAGVVKGKAGFRYRVQRTLQLTPTAWTNVPHALAVGDPVTLDTVAGTGAGATVFVDAPANASAFFRIQMEPLLP